MSNEELIIEKLFVMNKRMSKDYTKIFNLLRKPSKETAEKIRQICLKYKDRAN